MFIRILAISVLWLFICSSSRAEDAVEIPLSEVWGHKIGGTRDIKDLEPEIDSSSLSKNEIFERSMIQRIRRSLSSYRRSKNKGFAGTAFVVTGTGSEALKNAHAVLVAGHQRAESFSKDSELTLVFYCYESGRYVPLDSITREGNDITVQYHFAAHNTANMSTHFALIPIGKMSPGTVHINIEQLDGVGPDWGPKAAAIDPKLVRQIVCDSTSFNIE
jgi:hypothetical protein